MNLMQGFLFGTKESNNLSFGVGRKQRILVNVRISLLRYYFNFEGWVVYFVQ